MKLHSEVLKKTLATIGSNPHTFFYIDVKGKGGKSVKWALETGSPRALLSRGWTRDIIKIGDRVKVYAPSAGSRPSG